MHLAIFLNLFLFLQASPDTGKKITLPLLTPKTDIKFDLIDSVVSKLNNPPSRIIWLTIRSSFDYDTNTSGIPNAEFQISNIDHSRIFAIFTPYFRPFGYYKFKDFIVLVDAVYIANYFFKQTNTKMEFGKDELEKYVTIWKYNRISVYFCDFVDGKFRNLRLFEFPTCFKY